MGTLTAGQLRLDHYCEHKLPTSCRLSSIGECCACYDERAHSVTYSTYIDGVGFVQRGTRWQRYCWFCKEFWENRVQASGLTPGQTKIPERPDQTEFLRRWYQFHQGFRIVTRDDGSEERVAVLGEDLRDVSPGCLPRTLDELRAGRERSEIEERERAEGERQRQAARAEETPQGPSIEETLDQMFQAAEREESQDQQPTPSRPDSGRPSNDIELRTTNIHAQAMTPAASRNRDYQARRIAALRRELHRMRNGIERVISGLRDLGENVPDHTAASTRLSQLGRTLDTIDSPPSQEDAQGAIQSVRALTDAVSTTQRNGTLSGVQARVDEARQHVDEARRNRDQAATELDLAEQDFRTSQARLRQLQNEQRTTENYMRLFGTREEMIAQGESYESPIGGMFTRAMERFRVAEDVRREERTLRQVLHDEERAADPDVAQRLAELETRERDVWGVPRPSESQSLQDTNISRHVPPSHSNERPTDATRAGLNLFNTGTALEDYHALLRGQDRVQRNRTAVDTDNFPRNMLNALPSQQRAPGATFQDILTYARDSRNRRRQDAPTIVAGLPGLQLDEDPYENNDRGLDAVFVLNALSNNPGLRSHVPWADDGNAVSNLLCSVQSNTLSSLDVGQLEPLMELEEVVWGSQLPAERNRRRRERGETVSFTPDAYEMAMSGQVIVHDVEVMAECYQMSGQVRAQSGVTALEQLPMLYRLQAGERNSRDRAVLVRMLRSDTAMNQASQVLAQHVGETDEAQSDRRAELESERRQAARRGDHSRSELDAQRRATRTMPSVALTASRAAMATSPRTLLERMANRDEETRAAYERLRANGFEPGEPMTSRSLRDAFYRPLSLGDFGASPSATDSDDEDNEGRGLDAKDSGRPEEPMTEEEMTILLDCRICYSQKADICTIPCGHLAMCRWCSEQHSPTMAQDKTRPRRPAACPVCRKRINQKIQVHRS
ncbi:uncharacterized protein RCC_10689 [Lecanosticta acicola]|uniref:Uncharacterized protein RCC_10689 n=1 Tax=Lecanosticta acicola TaxID=111012 RepID=A0AAI8YZB6_9PEZI|nr:uncharacterized protein RCC_10689 [Lecanosticta acicola]